MAFAWLFTAIALEVGGTSLLKATEGFTRPGPTVVCLAAYALSFAALAQAVKGLPVGLIYAMWSALGTVAIVAIGAAFLGDPIRPATVVGVVLVVAGVVVLNLGGAHA